MQAGTVNKSSVFSGRVRAIAGGLLISLISTVICLIVSEAILRLGPFPFVKQLEERRSLRQGKQEVHPKGLYAINPAIGWTITPGFRGRFVKREFDILVEGNGKGLRDRDYGPKPENTARILGLGDSFAFGWGVELQESFYKVLEEKLNRELSAVSHQPSAKDESRKLTADSYEVINAGIPSYGTYEEFNMLKVVGMTYDPDLVIVAFYEGNDYRNNGDAPRNREIRNGYLADMEDGENDFIRFFSDRSILAYFLQLRIASIRSKTQMATRVEKSKRYILELKNFLAGKNIPFVFVFIPDQDKGVYERPKWLMQYDRLLGGMDLFQARAEIEKFCRDSGINYYRLSEAFENAEDSRQLRLKDTHFNKRGHAQAAEEIFKFLTEKFIGR